MFDAVDKRQVLSKVGRWLRTWRGLGPSLHPMKRHPETLFNHPGGGVEEPDVQAISRSMDIHSNQHLRSRVHPPEHSG